MRFSRVHRFVKSWSLGIKKRREVSIPLTYVLGGWLDSDSVELCAGSFCELRKVSMVT